MHFQYGLWWWSEAATQLVSQVSLLDSLLRWQCRRLHYKRMLSLLPGDLVHEQQIHMHL